MNIRFLRALGFPLIGALLLLPGLAPVLAASIQLPVMAEAFDPVTGERLYSRSMSYSTVDGEVIASRASYHGPDRRLIASRVNDYSRLDPGGVVVELRLHELGWVRGARRFLDSQLALWDLREAGARARKRLVPYDESSLFDGGIEPFVLEHLDALLDGKTLRASFVSVARQSEGRLRFDKRGAGAGDGTETIVIKTHSRRLMPAGETLIRVDTQRRRLLDYRGPSDLPDADGALFEVLLRYVY